VPAARAIAVVAAVCAAACVEPEARPACGPHLSEDITVSARALSRFAEQVVAAREDVTAACTAIATDLGATVPPPRGGAPDDDLRTACGIARAELEAERTAGVTIEVVATSPRCPIDGEAQIECETECDVDALCPASTVDARCPADLRVDPGECDGPLSPPDCELRSPCVVGCRALGLFGAECLPGDVSVTVMGPASPALETTLERNLPVILAVRDGLAPRWADTMELFQVAAGVGAAVALVPACATARAAPLGAAIQQAASAAATARSLAGAIDDVIAPTR
jgi:hypothetical protein